MVVGVGDEEGVPTLPPRPPPPPPPPPTLVGESEGDGEEEEHTVALGEPEGVKVGRRGEDEGLGLKAVDRQWECVAEGVFAPLPVAVEQMLAPPLLGLMEVDGEGVERRRRRPGETLAKALDEPPRAAGVGESELDVDRVSVGNALGLPLPVESGVEEGGREASEERDALELGMSD